MQFFIGQKLVCVADFRTAFSEKEIQYGLKYPLLNRVYTIREIVGSPATGFRFNELKNKKTVNSRNEEYEIYFYHNGFKIYEEVTGTDISVFKAMLNISPRDFKGISENGM